MTSSEFSCFLKVLPLIAIVSIAAIACGNTGEPPNQPSVIASDTELNPANESTLSTDNSSVSASIDGVFTVGEGSEATFTVNEQLAKLPLPNDAVLRTDVISGNIDLSNENASLVIDLHTLKSDESRRDKYVRTQLFPSQPTAFISVTEFPPVPEGFTDGQSFTSTIIATVNVNGVDADIEFELESRLDTDRLLVLVKADFTWADFGMPTPTSRFWVLQDEVHVEALVSATPNRQ